MNIQIFKVKNVHAINHMLWFSLNTDIYVWHPIINTLWKYYISVLTVYHAMYSHHSVIYFVSELDKIERLS